MTTELTGSHRTTYDTIFRHPLARNLQWRDVRALLGAVADKVEEDEGTLKATRHERTLVLHRPSGKDLTDVHELMELREFLRHAAAPDAPAPGGSRPADTDFLVVLDHREARVYRTELSGSVPQRIVPYDPDGLGRHLHHVEDDATGQRRPEPEAFYEAVARTLARAQRILVFGSGTGASSAMEQLLARLKRHHPDVAARVAGAFVVDEQHLTEDQLLARAREFYAGRAT